MSAQTYFPSQDIPGIAAAVMVPAGETLVFLSGHVSRNPAGRSLSEQFEDCFEGLRETLERAGSNMESLVKVTIFVSGLRPEHLPEIRTVRNRYVPADALPASSLIGVAQLFAPDVLVEVEAVAVRKNA
ncbi:MAG TPA: Rid family hydrolase [Acidobacteriaceae bacterium]|jgi:enamine deaminase RidA (YjgF/YER057c/UK114 family)